MENLDNKSLLFWLSGKSTTAEKAAGMAAAWFEDGVTLVPGGGIAMEARSTVAWQAEKNMYAERGTLSFFWRSRFPVGATAFPIFRAGYADHSSWDQCFLRIDYNGESGIEAFVTDINLNRIRCWGTLETFPAPEEWFHIALTWDETVGVRLYVNGKELARKDQPAVYFAGLYGFGPHARIIGPWHVQSDYNFTRGGDTKMIAVYDHALTADEIAVLGEGKLPDAAPFGINYRDPAVKEVFRHRNGLTGPVPRVPENACARKVEVSDAYDLKRWWYKGMDGIRETTWPGVYNRSRLEGRNDYFQLPDWDCYSVSGKTLELRLPHEPYNHVEISGSAAGKLEAVDETGFVKEELLERPAGYERTADTVPAGIGGRVRFTNGQMEDPIGDISFFNVYEGCAPAGARSVTYRVMPGRDAACEGSASLYEFIDGRFLPYEKMVYTAVPEGEEKDLTGACDLPFAAYYPFYHVVIPYEADDAYGLDGIELSFDTLADRDAVFSVQVKDPLWYYRNLAQFTFRGHPGKRQTLWLDVRDRILPEKRALYLTIAVTCPKAGAALMKSLTVRTVFKKAAEAKAEHVQDRFTQIRDLTGHFTEESPFDNRYWNYTRWQRDILDLLKVDPDHELGWNYYAMIVDRHPKEFAANATPDYLGRPMPEPKRFDYNEPVPEGVPAWAYKQVEYLRHYKKIIQFYIDERQIENGELGGGLSDDGDFVATWGQLALMDADGAKVKKAMETNEQAFFDQGLFTNGLCSIQADELHSSEEGQVSLCACMNTFPGKPHWLEHAMEMARQLDWITGVNEAGHRHVKSCYYSGSVIAEDHPWGSQQSCSFISLEVAWQVALYNGNPYILSVLKELADSMRDHFHEDENYLHTYIRFEDDEEQPDIGRRNNGNRLLMIPAAWMLNDPSYMAYLTGGGKGMAVENGGMCEKDTGIPLHPIKAGTADVIDKDAIAKRYAVLNNKAGMKEYYCTEGHPWIDRVYCEPAALYCDRLADPSDAQVRCTFPMNRIAWQFTNWGDDERVAIISPICEADHIRVITHNLSDRTVLADMFGWNVKPGKWELVYGTDTDDDDRADEHVVSQTVTFENTRSVRLILPAGRTTAIEMRLLEEGTPYWQRPDLGVDETDIRVFDHGINVRIHSLGAVAAPPVNVVLKDTDGNVLKCAKLPAMEAPTDLLPRTRDVIFYLHHVTEAQLKGAYVEIDPENTLCEITRMNNIVKIDGALKKRKPVLSTR